MTNQIFFVTEGINRREDGGETYESMMTVDMDPVFFMKLLCEFLEASKRGPARLMLSNRSNEDWR